jgi:hypothetical protein
MAMTEVHLFAERVDSCAIPDWDSGFWGVHVAKVQGDSLTEERVRDIDVWCKGNDIRCLYFLGRPDDPTTTQRNYAAQRLYQRCGFLTGSIHLWYHKWYVPQVV